VGALTSKKHVCAVWKVPDAGGGLRRVIRWTAQSAASNILSSFCILQANPSYHHGEGCCHSMSSIVIYRVRRRSIILGSHGAGVVAGGIRFALEPVQDRSDVIMSSLFRSRHRCLVVLPRHRLHGVLRRSPSVVARNIRSARPSGSLRLPRQNCVHSGNVASADCTNRFRLGGSSTTCWSFGVVLCCAVFTACWDTTARMRLSLVSIMLALRCRGVLFSSRKPATGAAFRGKAWFLYLGKRRPRTFCIRDAWDDPACLPCTVCVGVAGYRELWFARNTAPPIAFSRGRCFWFIKGQRLLCASASAGRGDILTAKSALVCGASATASRPHLRPPRRQPMRRPVRVLADRKQLRPSS